MANLLTKFRKPFPDRRTKQTIPGPYRCPLCNASGIDMLPLYSVFDVAMRMFFREYQKHQFIHNVFQYETFNIADHFCSNCLANDKDRLYALYIDAMIKTTPGKTFNLLDIAPTTQLTGLLKKKPEISYRSMDLYMEGVDDKADITDMHIYAEEQFDFFICSHVLEHIPEDQMAMQELYRITKKGGGGIVMVPINFGVDVTLEDPYGMDISARWKYFGQDDHVRMYAKHDFIARLEAAGFKVTQLGKEHFTPEVFEKNAIYPTSVLYVVSKS